MHIHLMVNVKKMGYILERIWWLFLWSFRYRDKYCIITVLDGEPIGHISWDPRHKPDYVEIGHNCIITKYKGKGYGYFQLEELKNIMI